MSLPTNARGSGSASGSGSGSGSEAEEVEMDAAGGAGSRASLTASGKAAGAGAPPGSRLERLSTFVAEPLERFFERLGLSVARSPYRTLAIAALVVVLCSAGFTRWQSESRPEKLWVPSGATALEHQKFVQDNFEKDARFNSLIVRLPGGSGSVLTRAAVLATFDVHDRVLAVNATVSGTYAADFPGSWDYSRICERRGGVCLQRSVLDYFFYDRTRVPATDEGVLAVFNDESRLVSVIGEPLPLRDTVGGLERDAGSGLVTGAEAFAMTYYVTNNEVVSDGDRIDPPAEAWEESFIDEVVLLPDPAMEVEGFNIWAQSDEFSNAIRGDLALIGAGYFLIIIYTASQLGHLDRVHAKVALTFGAVLTVGLAIVAAFGLAAGIGTFYGPVHSVLPFLLLGLGVDDSFVIVHAFYGTYLKHPDPVGGGGRDEDEDEERGQAAASFTLPERIAATMRHAGVSITVTSMTDMLAFLVGATTSLPALSSFCIYAALGILALWSLQSTLFVALLTLDARRASQNRLDCCCCFRSSRAPRPAVPPSEAAEMDRDAAVASRGCVAVCRGPHKVRRALTAVVAPLVTDRRATAAVLVAFAGLATFGIYGATQLEQEFDLNTFVPSDSYLQPYFDLNDRLFSQGVRVQVVARDADQFEEQARLTELYETMRGSRYLNGPATSSWYESFRGWLPGTYVGGVDGDGRPTNRTGFFVAVHDFVNSDDGAAFSSDVVFASADRPADGITTSRLFGAYLEERVSDSRKQVDAMDGLRAEVAAVPELNAFPYATDFLFWEQYKVITGELVRNVLLSLAAVFLVTTLLIAHPVTSGLVFLCVALTLVDLLGLMWAWDLNIDSVAVVNLVLATGLAVDYSAHIGHCFMHQTGTRPERAVKAVADIGGSVLNGAVSTFLAVLVLAWSKSYVFIVFFRMFLGTILFGVAHGMVLLPVLLGLVGPLPYRHHDVAAVVPAGKAVAH